MVSWPTDSLIGQEEEAQDSRPQHVGGGGSLEDAKSEVLKCHEKGGHVLSLSQAF